MTTRSATRIAGRGEIDPADPASARPPLRAVREFLEQLTRTPDPEPRRRRRGRRPARFRGRFPGFLLADGKTTDHGDVAADLRHAVLDAPATTDPSLRAAAAAGGPLPEPCQSYVTAVRDASYTITDTDIARLTAAGHRGSDLRDHRGGSGRRGAPQLRRRPERARSRSLIRSVSP